MAGRIWGARRSELVRRGDSPSTEPLRCVDQSARRRARDAPARALRTRIARAAREVSTAGASGGRDVVSALVGARCRLRPRKRHIDRCACFRWLVDLGAEGLDVGRWDERLRTLDRPDGSGDRRDGGPLVPTHGHEATRSRGSTAAPDVWRVPLQRGFPRWRLCTRGIPGRPTRRRALDSENHARQRTVGDRGRDQRPGRRTIAAAGDAPRPARGTRRPSGPGRGLCQREDPRSHPAQDCGRRRGARRWVGGQAHVQRARPTLRRCRVMALGGGCDGRGLAGSPPWRERLLFAPGLRIGGGTDEIQRNAIAERGLSLPRS